MHTSLQLVDPYSHVLTYLLAVLTSRNRLDVNAILTWIAWLWNLYGYLLPRYDVLSIMLNLQIGGSEIWLWVRYTDSLL